MLTIERPIVIFDLETTGVDVRTDRIVQIAMIKLNTDGKLDSKCIGTVVNPTIPIPPEVTAVHGITDVHVRGAPTFADLADDIIDYLDGCNVAGYNVERFDLPVLRAELERVRCKLRHDPIVVDVYQIYARQETRTLNDAAILYTGVEHTEAHDAMADVDMTRRILLAQAERYGAETIEELIALGRDPNWVDAGGRFVSIDGVVKMNFGQWKGVPLSKVDLTYLQWMMRNDFDDEVLGIVRDELMNRRGRW